MACSSCSLSGFVKLLSNMVFIGIVHKYLALWTYCIHTLMSHSGGKTFITVTTFPVSLLACLQTHNHPCSWLIDEVGGGWPHLSSRRCAICRLQGWKCTGTFGFGSVEYMTRTIPFKMTVKKYMVWSNTTMVYGCWYGRIVCGSWHGWDTSSARLLLWQLRPWLQALGGVCLTQGEPEISSQELLGLLC